MVRSGLALTLALCVGWAAAHVARAETVRLKNGNIITGDVLAEKAEWVVLDLGYTVLQVPREQVAAVVEEAAAAPAAVEPAAEGTLYRQARLKPRTVKELVADFGEGLVKVRTPQGVGSGFFINDQGHVITNAHVIQGETQITVNMFVKRGETFTIRQVKDVQIVAVNPVVDLALLITEAGCPDSDRDGIPNDADDDNDNDGVPNAKDAFPLEREETADVDGDRIGDSLDADIDADGKADDLNRNGVPDNEETDWDADGVPNAHAIPWDAFPRDPKEWRDTDGDGIGDNADPDDDGDGYTDEQEKAAGTDPLDPLSFPAR